MRGMILGLIFLAGVAGAQQDSRYEIRLLGRSWTPAAGVPQEMDRALAAQAAGRERIHALVQLYGIPDDSQRAELARQGIELGPHVPGNAWIATISADRAAAAARRPEVRWMAPWTAADKLHPRLAAGELPEWIAVMVQLHEDVDLGRGAALAERAGGQAGRAVETLHGTPMWIPRSGLAALAAEEEVLWIEEIPPPLSATDNGVRTQMKVNTVNSSPYDLDGEGVRLFIFDSGSVNDNHETFEAGAGTRVTVIDGSAPVVHATHVAGTAAGDGSGSPSGNGRGMAPAATILSAGFHESMSIPLYDDYGDIETDYITARNTYDADLANNSIGLNLAEGFPEEPCWREGDYGTTSILVDEIVRDSSDTGIDGTIITVWSNGNERDGIGEHGRCGANYGTTTSPACAKNPIHVGAINSDGGSMTRFSGWGPCDDGRLKPTVVAPGCETDRTGGDASVLSANCSFFGGPFCDGDDHSYVGDCGTSMAAPAVSGTIALLLQDWRRHLLAWYPSVEEARLLPALVKAALIHTSRDLGPEGPDYRYGYGAVNAQALIDFERAAGTGGLGGPGLKVWGTQLIDHGDTDTFDLTLPSGISELKASLAWDDRAAQAFAAVQLVNDLDLELKAPDGTVYRPFVLDPDNPHLPATVGVNDLDNQEQVLVKNPQPGLWKVRVVGTYVPYGLQAYGLVYSATPPAFSSSCSETASSFEAGNDSWGMTGGAVREAAPGTGHGSWSARLGGANNSTPEMARQFALPGHQRSILSFDLYMTTDDGAGNTGYDEFTAEVRSLSNNVLAVLSYHNDGDVEGVWLQERNMDLSQWAGQTVQVVFRVATSPSNLTTFWADDVRVTSCQTTTQGQTTLTIPSTGSQDGHVFESSETSNAGGAAVWNNSSLFGPATFQVGDNGSDLQIKGFVSFDTSGLPDDAVLVSARLILSRSAVLGTNPFDTHGICRVGIKTGAFNNNPSLEPIDFQSPATGQPVAILSNPTVNGSLAYATLSAQGVAAINKTGTTQLRLFFEKDDNDDLSGDALFFIAGEDTNTALRPKLEVKYMLP